MEKSPLVWTSDYYYVSIACGDGIICLRNGYVEDVSSVAAVPDLREYTACAANYILLLDGYGARLDNLSWMAALPELYKYIYATFTVSVGNPNGEEVELEPDAVSKDTLAVFAPGANHAYEFGQFHNVIRHASGRHPVVIYRKIDTYYNFCAVKN